MSRSQIITSKLKQTAIYWGSPVSDGQGGRTFDDPVEVSVRWEERQEKFISAAGQEAMSKAILYVEQDMDLGGYLFLGSLTDLASDEETDPLIVDNAYAIQASEKTPNLKADVFLRKLWL